MEVYHKIQTIFKRDPNTKFKTLLLNDFSIPEFEYLQNNMWAFTEKVDGTNIRVGCEAGKVTFSGKTDTSQIPSTLVAELIAKFHPLESVLKECFGEADVCLYGEGYGARIQNGGKYRADQSFVLFDVRVGDWWLLRKDVDDIATKLGLDIVPIIGSGTLNDMIKLVQAGIKSTWGDFDAEGIVARPITELKCRNGDRVITKLKHKDFKGITCK